MDVQSLVQVLMSVLGCVGMLLLREVTQTLKEMKESVEELNINVAVIIEKVNSHEKRIAHLEGDKLK